MPKAVPIITNFTAGELSPRLEGRVDISKYANGCRQLENFIVHPHGGATRRSGFRYIAGVKDHGKKVCLIPFVFSVVQAYILEFGHYYLRVYMDQGQVLSGGAPYEISTPYSEADLGGIKFCQSADVMYLVHRSYAPRKLSRTGHTNWTLATVSFGAQVDPPTGLAATLVGSGSGTTHQYVVTSLTSEQFESVESGAASTSGPDPLSTSNYVRLTWTAASGGAEYNVYKNRNGVYGKIGRAIGGTFYDKGETAPDYLTTPPDPNDPFTGAGDYPSAVTFYEQRLCWAGTNNEPMTLWLSKTGDYENLDRSSPARDDDSCKFTLNADQINLIRWLVPSRLLLIGTAGSEWHLGGAGGGPVTPTSVEARRETLHGSADLQPVIVGNIVIFLDRAGRKVREFVYNLDMDGYAAPDLSILAEHLTRTNRIVEWAYQQDPHSIIWCVRDDGMLLGLTYQRDHQVVAWHRHVTAGEFESVAVIPGGTRDEVWVAVRREINGETRRFVELLEGEFTPEVEAGEADTVDAFFVDSGLSHDEPRPISGASQTDPVVISAAAHGFTAGDRVKIVGVQGMVELNGRQYLVASPGTDTFALSSTDGTPVDGTSFSAYRSGGEARKMVDTLSGLEHLAGEEAAILADGAVHPSRTVTSGGALTLDYPAAVAHAGLPYQS
ncbi:MAG: ubiquitin-activating E1 FCCH domain-containing protein, partial [Thermodesulfobacteriota bacterium]